MTGVTAVLCNWLPLALLTTLTVVGEGEKPFRAELGPGGRGVKLLPTVCAGLFWWRGTFGGCEGPQTRALMP